MLNDIHPRSPVSALRRDFSREELDRTFDADLICVLAGMSPAFVRRVLGQCSDTLSLSDALLLLDQGRISGNLRTQEQDTYVPSVPKLDQEGPLQPTMASFSQHGHQRPLPS